MNALATRFIITEELDFQRSRPLQFSRSYFLQNHAPGSEFGFLKSNLQTQAVSLLDFILLMLDSLLTGLRGHAANASRDDRIAPSIDCAPTHSKAKADHAQWHRPLPLVLAS